MADRPGDDGAPREGTPEYRWLYGEGGRPVPPDATRHIPTAPPPSSRRRAGASAGAGDGHHQQLPSSPVAPPPRGPGRPPTPGTRPGGRRPTSTARKVWRGVKVALLLWVVFLLVTPFLAWSKVDRVDAFAGVENRPPRQSATAYLVVGSDSRAGLTKEEQKKLGTGGDDVGQRTDTIMLLHTGKGPNVLMSIPRDSRVEIPGRGTAKINAAYAWGGAPLLVETIEKNTGIEIDHYVEIGFGGLVKMVDAVGGVEICPRKPMKDKQAKLDIEAGCQQADGATALGYSRSRKTYKALGDVDRARAQREVVSAIGAKALSPMTVLNPVRYWQTGQATATALTVSEGTSAWAMARFGLAMTRVDGESGLTCGVPLKDLSVRWDPDRSAELFKHLRANHADGIPDGLCTADGFPAKKKG